MEDITKPDLESIWLDGAVRMKDCIVVLGSQQLWSYNLWTGQWKECQIHVEGKNPQTEAVFSAAIRSAVYIFYGFESNVPHLWK